MSKNFRQKGGAEPQNNNLFTPSLIISILVILFLIIISLALLGVGSRKKKGNDRNAFMIPGGLILMIAGILGFILTIIEKEKIKTLANDNSFRIALILTFGIASSGLVVMAVYADYFAGDDYRGSGPTTQGSATLSDLQQAQSNINNLGQEQLTSSLGSLKTKFKASKENITVNMNDFGNLRNINTEQSKAVQKLINQVNGIANLATLEEQQENAKNLLQALFDSANITNEQYVTEEGINADLQLQKAVAGLSYLLSVCGGQCNEQFAGLNLANVAIKNFL